MTFARYVKDTIIFVGEFWAQLDVVNYDTIWKFFVLVILSIIEFGKKNC